MSRKRKPKPKLALDEVNARIAVLCARRCARARAHAAHVVGLSFPLRRSSFPRERGWSPKFAACAALRTGRPR